MCPFLDLCVKVYEPGKVVKRKENRYGFGEPDPYLATLARLHM